ncbi:DUF1840 domain-containing protein [Comamonas composti]|uniref:DUF1840 domain-containing protein n=1 Tax=Comamonas composti TaxID=408558 RepID=UPI0004023EE6|nr:DUF1840 domain-containing protein [Comamonas composti]
MLYKFKSRATADVIMLEANGRQILQILGKTPGESGIITVQQIPVAIAALQAAVAEDEARRKAVHEDPDADAAAETADAVGLHQRVAPLLDMLRRSAAEERDVTW